jgi:uracil-DNA glycosylase family 4
MLPRSMKAIFNEALRNLRNKAPEGTFGQQLYQAVGWSFAGALSDQQEPIKGDITEKTLVLDAFHDFSHEKIDQSPEGKISFKGGEISKRPEADISVEYTTSKKSDNELIDLLEGFLPSTQLQQRFLLSDAKTSKLQCVENIRVMFINDTLNGEEAENYQDDTENLVPQLSTAFDLQASELFAKMIKAMKLEHWNFVISGTKVKTEQDEKDYMPCLFEEIAYFKPQMVITLGAVATQTLLKNKDRLAKIHGSILHKSIAIDDEIHSFQLMPLFHPELLLINPNMKKTAWLDMQKAMKELEL